MKELKKWLGDEIKVSAIGDSSKAADHQVAEMMYGESDVLVISYDQLKIRLEDVIKMKLLILSLSLVTFFPGQ